jgi:hypothetical protein
MNVTKIIARPEEQQRQKRTQMNVTRALARPTFLENASTDIFVADGRQRRVQRQTLRQRALFYDAQTTLEWKIGKLID